MKTKRSQLRAFSTPEVLLSVFVLSAGLVTIVAVMSGSLRHSLINRNITIATELAQEGVELVRNVRDNDFASGGTGFAAFSNNRHCRIDWNDSVSSLNCSGSKGSAAFYALSYSSLYEHGGSGGGSRFGRYIYIDYDTAGGERALVRSFVFWGEVGVPGGNNGSVSGCTTTNSCVFTETFLTAWK